MNKNSAYVNIIIIFICVVLLHRPILILISNITSNMRYDNEKELLDASYKMKIENLEKQLADYEQSYENLKILSSSSYIRAKMAIRDIYDFYDYILISTDSKVNIGSAVINEDGLVGIVDSVDGNIAKVLLITKSSTSVRVGKSYGLLNEYDKKNKLLIIHNINNYENIEIDDEVVTSGLSKIDGNIKIGKVKDVVTEGIERLIYVEPYVDYDELNYLMVINK